MSKQIDALKQALGALERHAELGLLAGATIIAIREALAEQPAQQPHCNDCGGFDPECPLAQPVQQEIEELTAQRDKLADILTRTANALKGQPAELSLHSWHDLPEVAQQLKAAQQQEPVAWITQNGKGWLRWHKPEDNNTDSVPLYTSPPASKPWAGLTEEQMAVLNFMLGADDLDGVWFGERHPKEKGAFWWRNRLRNAFQDAAIRAKGETE